MEKKSEIRNPNILILKEKINHKADWSSDEANSKRPTTTNN
jgi:hypothetical protein